MIDAPPRLLRPGLTDRQTQRLQGHLLQLTATASALSIYTDADRYAGRWMATPAACGREPALSAVDGVRADHLNTPIILVAYVTGMAQGIRIGRTFAPIQRRAKQWISEEYRRLTVAGRRDVQRYIRKLLKIEQRKPAAAGAPAATEATHAREWARQMGSNARTHQRA